MKDIKTDEYYRVLGYVGYKNENEVSVTFHNKSGIQTSIDFERKEARRLFSPIPEHPKYDPCRKFRKGDKVRVVEWQGRDIARVGQIGYVVSDEKNSIVELCIDGWTKDVFYPACHLELVTPVEEELGPYSVRHSEAHAAWSIYGPFGLSAVNYFYGERYPYTKETAKAAAEAERDRLNAAHRKEQQ